MCSPQRMSVFLEKLVTQMQSEKPGSDAAAVLRGLSIMVRRNEITVQAVTQIVDLSEHITKETADAIFDESLAFDYDPETETTT